MTEHVPCGPGYVTCPLRYVHQPGATALNTKRVAVPEDRPPELRGTRCLQQLLPAPPKELSPYCTPVAVHENTLFHEELCLRNRVLMRVPVPNRRGRQMFQRAADEYIDALKRRLGPVQKWGIHKTLKHLVSRHGAKLYEPAFHSLRERALDSRDARLKFFLKAEKWRHAPGTSLKTPRAIQYRGPRYNLLFGKFICPIEEAIYGEMTQSHSIMQVHTSKTLTPNQRAEQVSDLWHRFKRPMALCLDHSRFDAHVSPFVLREEHRAYKALCSDPLFDWLLRMQINNKGTTTFGIKYSLKGSRMSGDMNTALGNTLINAIALLAITRGLNVEILAEGDDGLVFGERGDLEALLQTIDRRALDMGFELKVKPAYCLAQIDYCSGGVIETRTGYKHVREWPKPLDTDSWSPRFVTGEGAVDKAYTTAYCYAQLYRGLPVYQTWARYMLSHTPRGLLDPKFNRELWEQAHLVLQREGGSKTFPEIDMTARSSFAEWSGVLPSEQLELEQWLESSFGPHSTVL